MADPSRVGVSGPLERYAAGFLAELVGLGYRPVSSAFQLQLMAHLSRWVEADGLAVEELLPTHVERFLTARRAAGYTNYLSPKALAPLLGYLRGLGVVPPVRSPAVSAVEALLARYRAYLIGERGLVTATADCYADMARPFVLSRVDESGKLDLDGLTPSGVLAFVLAQAERRPRRSAKLMVTALRSLLRFLHVEGLIARPLAKVVPSVASWRLSGLPRGLERDQVRDLLAKCSRQTTVGRRDLAILSMLVRLGMRRGEVAALALEDIDWRAGRGASRSREGEPSREAAFAGRRRRSARVLSAPRSPLRRRGRDGVHPGQGTASGADPGGGDPGGGCRLPSGRVAAGQRASAAAHSRE
jgi:integrase/recombinase XerD